MKITDLELLKKVEIDLDDYMHYLCETSESKEDIDWEVVKNEIVELIEEEMKGLDIETLKDIYDFYREKYDRKNGKL